MPRPDLDEYASYYVNYVNLVPEEDILAALRSESASTRAFLDGVPEGEAGRKHPPYTWTVREVVGHMIDAERIFGYRALRFARGDETPLPGFDENAYAESAESDHRPLADLAAEFQAVRLSNLALFAGLSESAWSRRGVANGQPVSVRGLAYILVGHERHHGAILRKRLAQARGE
jgi:hypothetical protein